MIERFHRSLKAAILLLGLRASFKEDIKTSAAELVYGTPLRLPAEFFTDEDPSPDPQIFLEHLQQHMRKVRASPSAHHIKSKAFALKDLHSCSHVFVRVDAIKKPLNQPYEGPYEVIERISDYVFKINIKGEPSTISTERLKPAYYEVLPTEPDALHTQSPAVPTISSTLKTYSGPKPKKTVRFST
ncbi:PREDICTED: uncharacterized protein LOC105456631 [Wasmannia auropunctata]|uniref:uncharacterized protein LOC105456631 n=1 Tax=Wasmannia auropunctata TaxID=64793 RepID=UPI0005EE6FCB|nr:PREDICTED: uncharacterized protein LOC105456631 [Wasmannia auropunctata]